MRYSRLSQPTSLTPYSIPFNGKQEVASDFSHPLGDRASALFQAAGDKYTQMVAGAKRDAYEEELTKDSA